MYPRLLSSGKPRETGATRICYSRETILALNPNRERNVIGTGTAGRGRHGSGFGRGEGREGGGGGKRGREEDGAQGHNPLLALNPNRERNVIGTGTAGRGGHGSGFGRGEGRGGGGRSGREEDGAQGHNPRQIRLGFKALQELDTKTPDEIILDLMSSRRFPATEFLLTQQSSMKDDWIVLTVSIVAKACSCNSKEYLIKLLNLLPKSLFFTSHLRTFLNRLSACRMPATEVATFLRNVLRIMKELLRIFPNSYADLPVSELYCGIRIFSETQQPDGALVAEGEELMQLRNQKADELKKQEEENQYRRRPRRDGEGA